MGAFASTRAKGQEAGRAARMLGEWSLLSRRMDTVYNPEVGIQGAGGVGEAASDPENLPVLKLDSACPWTAGLVSSKLQIERRPSDQTYQR